MAWTYEQLFNALSTGTLDGQDSWTGATAPFLVSADASCRYEGAQGLDTGTGGNFRRSITNVTSGIVYYSVKYKTANASGDGPYFSLKRSTAYGTIVKIYQNGGVNKIACYNGAGTYTDQQTVTVDTWYVVAIEFDCSRGTKGQFRVSIDGGAFSSWYDFVGNLSSGSDTIEIGMDASLWAGCLDRISPNPVSTAYYKTLDDVITLVDTTAKQPGKVLAEVLTLVDTQIKDISKVLGEVATLVDTMDTSYIFATSLNEILTLVDTQENKITGKTLFEAVTLVDTAYKSVARSLAEVVTLVDTIDNLKLYGRDFTDAITLVDTVTKEAGKTIAEIVTLVDTIANAKQYSRTFDEIATLVDDVLLAAGKVLNDAVTLVDTLAKVGTFARALSETVTLTERFQALLNGQNIAWIRKYANQAGTFIKKYLEIP